MRSWRASGFVFLCAATGACTSPDVSTASSSGGSASTGSASTGSASSGSTTSGSSGSSTSSTGGSTIANCVLVPLYAYPSDGTTWVDLAAAATAHPGVEIVAIVNPDDGPGQVKDPAFTDGIAALQAANVTVIGYVATQYGMKPSATVDSETDQYAALYPGLDGIFFDEMSSDTGLIAKYGGLGSHAKAVIGGITVGNPGTSVAVGLLTTMDRVVVYENPGLPDPASLTEATANASRDKFAILPFNVPTLDASFVASAADKARCIYITDDDVPNPWDTLPDYFDNLLGLLDP
ncbi:MAG: spherulation-specific family 4 protein [Polyangiaceae bacterium]